MIETDQQLLVRYAKNRAEDAFGELVRRHLDLVHSAALRQVGSPSLAEEVVQSVFVDLARSVERLKPGTVVAAWLYQVTRRTAVDVIRHESRRQIRERLAAEMNAMNDPSDDWCRIEPLLDEAVASLDEADRTALLLRYFENRSLREVGETMGTSDNAAQKRIVRALERLRDFFNRRGVATGTAGLAALISANSVQAAPAALLATVSAANVLVGGASATSFATTLAMTTLQKSLVTATLAVAVGFGLVQSRRAAVLRAEFAEARVRAETERLASSEALGRELAELRAALEMGNQERASLKDALAQAETDKARWETEREQARRSAALYRELAERPDRDSMDLTNAYPSARHVMSGIGRLLRRANQVKAQTSDTLSEEEKKAVERLKLELATEMIQIQKAGLLHRMNDDAHKLSPDHDSADFGTCLLYGALDLDEQQFGRVYSLLEVIERESKVNPLPAESTPEADAIRKRFDDQAKARIRSLLTPEQASVFDLIQSGLRTGPDGGRVDLSF